MSPSSVWHTVERRSWQGRRERGRLKATIVKDNRFKRNALMKRLVVQSL